MSVPLCRDCRHARSEIYLPVRPLEPPDPNEDKLSASLRFAAALRAAAAMYCIRPGEDGEPPTDPVNGGTIWATCKSERAAEWKCGQEGRFFVGRVKEDGA